MDTQNAVGPINHEGKDDVAIGHALGQRTIDLIKSHSRDLRRIVHDLFGVGDIARVAARKALDAFRREAAKNAVDCGEGQSIEGMTAKDWRRIASTATVRCSQMSTIIKAMRGGDERGGMTYETVAEVLKVPDPENVGFDAIYDVAKKFSATTASGKGRPLKPWQETLKTWLSTHVPEEARPDYKEAMFVYDKLQDMLHLYS